MAWPLAVGMLSYTVMGVVDTLLVGRLSTEALAGVGLGNIMVFTAMSFFRGLTMGAQSLVAAADGAKDKERVQRAAGAGIFIGLISGLLAALFLWMALRWALPYMADEPLVYRAADTYLFIRVFGMPLSLLSVGLMGGLQGLGDTQTRMWVSLVGNALNIGLDLLLIFGWGPFPRMEEQGAALATVISLGLMTLLYALRYGVLLGRPRLPSLEVLRSAIKLGFPAGIERLSGTTAFLVFTTALAKVGAAHLAANQIVINIISLSFLPGYGISEAGGVLVGRYLGAKSLQTAVKTVNSARALALWVMGACGLLFALGGEQLARAFSADPEVVGITVILLRYAAAFQLFDALVMVQLNALRSAGDTRYALWITTLASWGISVPTALFLAWGLGWGAQGAWLGMTVELALLALVSWRRVQGLGDGRIVRMDLLLGELNDSEDHSVGQREKMEDICAA